MAEHREPPPLFDDDDSRRDDDNEDLFSSAVQDVNTAGALGFEEPFSDETLFGISRGQEQLTAPAGTFEIFSNMSEPPTLPGPPALPGVDETPALLDIAEPPALHDVDGTPALLDIAEPPALPDVDGTPALLDIAEPPALPDLSADAPQLDDLASDSKIKGNEEVSLVIADEADVFSTLLDNTGGILSQEQEDDLANAGQQSTANDWGIPEPVNFTENLVTGVYSDLPQEADTIPEFGVLSLDLEQSDKHEEPNKLSDDFTLLSPALPTQTVEEAEAFTASGEPTTSEPVLTTSVPGPGPLEEDFSMFPKMRAQSLQKKPDTGFFLSEDETMEVSLDGLPAEPKIKPLTTEVSLDDDDDGLFSSGVLDTSAQTKSTAPSDVSATSTLPPMGAPITPPVVSPSSGVPDAPQAPLYTNTDAANANNITTPPMPAALGTGQPAGFYAPSQPPSMDRMGTANPDGEFIEILISEPQKVGDGMGSYMAYKMTTRTNISFFRKQCWSVTRRFSDYLGLHAKLVEKHLHAGRIIPPAPEKDALNTTKLRLSSGETVDGAAEFLERRRASLQRYMQRTAALPHLRLDPDFREFVELDSDLPRATQTSAMSSAGVLRLFNRVGETVNKITFKMEESDQWFEERAQQVEALEAELRRLHGALEGLAGGRRELAVGSSALSKAAAVLSSVEEHSALSRALHQLAEATDRTHTVYHAQADADFYILCETTRDYINLIGAVKEVFHERVKVFQAWQYSQTMLAKKRDAKAKLELTARQEKVAQAQQEVQEWEGKVERNQEHFERISGAIKKELEQFDVVRVQDFKSMLIRYLEAMVTSQQQVIKVWESFLPEAKAIS